MPLSRPTTVAIALVALLLAAPARGSDADALADAFRRLDGTTGYTVAARYEPNDELRELIDEAHPAALASIFESTVDEQHRGSRTRIVQPLTTRGADGLAVRMTLVTVVDGDRMALRRDGVTAADRAALATMAARGVEPPSPMELLRRAGGIASAISAGPVAIIAVSLDLLGRAAAYAKLADANAKDTSRRFDAQWACTSAGADPVAGAAVVRIGDAIVDDEPVVRYRQTLAAGPMIHDVSKRSGLPVQSTMDVDLDGDGLAMRMIRRYRPADPPIVIDFPACAATI